MSWVGWFFNEIVGGEKQRDKYNQYNTLADIHDVILVIEDGQAVGCGSFKRYNENVAEIKRVFVKKEYRRKGFAKFIMQALEQKARDNGYSKLILETGNALKAAMQLYGDIGYDVIENMDSMQICLNLYVWQSCYKNLNIELWINHKSFSCAIYL